MLASTIPRLVILTMIAIVVALAGVLVAVAQATPTPTPVPAPNLVIDKVGANSGSEVVTFDITVTNIGNSQSSQVLIHDSLSPDAYWFLLGATQTDGDNVSNITEQCKLVPGNPSGGTLVCDVTGIRERHLNTAQDDFVFGSVKVSVYGIARKCGVIENTAVFIHGLTIRSDSADATVPCPATPTPVPPTSTPTPTVVAPTATPVVVIITATPTATPTQRIAPLPPNTGDTLTTDTNRGSSTPASWIYASLIFLGISFTVGGVAAARRARA